MIKALIKRALTQGAHGESSGWKVTLMEQGGVCRQVIKAEVRIVTSALNTGLKNY